MEHVRKFFIARVIRGSGIGKKLGLPPTINLELSNNRPPENVSHGIYCVKVKTSVGTFGGVAHYGPRPAVKLGESFEVHCFGLNETLYGQEVQVEIGKKIRNIKNFSSVKELKKAIEEDVRIGLRCAAGFMKI